MSAQTASELLEAITLINDDITLLNRVDADLAMAVQNLRGCHSPVCDHVDRARREIRQRIEQHYEAQGVLRTRLKAVE